MLGDGWVEKSYDITNLIMASKYLDREKLSALIFEVRGGGPRDYWNGEWTTINYVHLEVTE